jgi:hypothetical protein
MRQSTPAGPVAIHGRVTGRVSKGSNQNGVAGSGCQVRRSACLRKLNFNKNCDCREFLVWPALAAAGVVWSVSSDTENTVFERSNPPPATIRCHQVARCRARSWGSVSQSTCQRVGACSQVGGLFGPHVVTRQLSRLRALQGPSQQPSPSCGLKLNQSRTSLDHGRRRYFNTLFDSRDQGFAEGWQIHGCSSN